jgi:hypothetical protein
MSCEYDAMSRDSSSVACQGEVRQLLALEEHRVLTVYCHIRVVVDDFLWMLLV